MSDRRPYPSVPPSAVPFAPQPPATPTPQDTNPFDSATATAQVKQAEQQARATYTALQLDGLAYRGRHAEEEDEPSGYRGWHVIGPLVYFAAVILMALGDFSIMILRFQALLHLPSSAALAGLPLDQLMGLLWLVTVAVYGAIIFDLHGISPTARPFSGATPRLALHMRRRADQALPEAPLRTAAKLHSHLARGIVW